MVMTRGQVALLAGFAALAPLAIDMYLPALPPLAADLGVSVERAGAKRIRVPARHCRGAGGGRAAVRSLRAQAGVHGGAGAVHPFGDHRGHHRPASPFCSPPACSRRWAPARRWWRDARSCATGWMRPRSARFFSLLALVGGLAPVLAPLLGALLIRFGDWRLIFWVMAGLSALLLGGRWCISGRIPLA